MKVCPKCGQRYEDDVTFCGNDGVTPIKLHSGGVTDDLIGKRLFGDYEVKKQLGEGGMGAVYLVEHIGMGQRIAVKVLHAQDPEQLQRFYREAAAITRLNHPNIIRVFSLGMTDDGLLYISMEYVDGKPLRDVIFDDGVISEKRAIRIMRQCLHTLGEAHDLGVIHRDLKPDNIMLTEFRKVRDFVKVLDFGIAKIKEKSGAEQKKLTQEGIVYGTPEYLSPEQAAGKEIDQRSDLYSMGVILYEMVTGNAPFTGNNAVQILMGHVYNEVPDPDSNSKQRIHPEMKRILYKALEKKTDKRYQSAMDFLADLEELEGKLSGGRSARTTSLDATQMSALFEASRSTGSSTVAANDQPTAPVATVASPGPDVPERAARGSVQKASTTPLYIIIAVLSVLLIASIVMVFLTLNG